jgi:hypothetical protein
MCNRHEKIKIVHTVIVKIFDIYQAGLEMILGHSGAGFRPASLTGKITSVARPYFHGYVVLLVISIGTIATTAHTIKSILIFYLFTADTGRGPLILSNSLGDLNDLRSLVPIN